MAPILTDYLSPAEYGLIGLLVTYSFILAPLISLNVNSYTALIITKYPKDEEKYYSSILLLILGVFTIVSIVFLNFEHAVSDLLEIPDAAISLLLLLTLTTVLSEIFQSILTFKQLEIKYLYVYGSKILIEVFLVVLFIAFLEKPWFYRVYSTVIALSVPSVLFIVFLWRRNTKLAFSMKLLGEVLLFSLPLIPHLFSKIGLNQADRIFIVKMSSEYELGIYNLGYMIGGALMYISSAFANVYNPYIYKRLANTNQGKIDTSVSAMFIVFISIIFICLVLLLICVPLVFNFFFPVTYLSSIKIVIPVAISYFFWSIYLAYSPFFFYEKKTVLISSISIIAFFFNLLANYWLVPLYGGLGAAYATLISFGIVLLIVSILILKIHKNFYRKFLEIKIGDFKRLKTLN